MGQRKSTARIEVRAEDLKAPDSLELSIVSASDCNSTRPIRNSLFVDSALLDSAACMNLVMETFCSRTMLGLQNTCDLCQTPILGTAANPKNQWIKLLQSLVRKVVDLTA